jgi:DNA-binding MarR family transcriptional regulator
MTDSITMKEAQERLGVSSHKMWRLVRDGILPARPNPLDRREKLIRLTDLERLMTDTREPRRFRSDGAGTNPAGPDAAKVKDWIRANWHRHDRPC